ncbi:HelD family protein [Motilibacter aurantiacus]|uniref:HelD family protein n=1 Tax=Motilibacter aurantiacus TaxID=2714955 RepID=UPI002F2B19D9
MNGVQTGPAPAERQDEPGPAALVARETAAEQEHLDAVYAQLDRRRAEVTGQLARAERTPTAGTPAARVERDALIRMYSEQAATLRGVEERLLFGRLDMVDGDRHYVGRVGLSTDDRVQLLLDWRAPAAAAFYQATAATPLGVARRRHLSTEQRRVTGIEDELLDTSSGDHTAVAGQGALLAALNARRSGRMRDIVTTIQGEQDRIIRAPLPGVLVVQGGPGTGKTAVALHRAAYLLFTHRDRIASSGVLVVGPNRAFLRYIEQVLPSLGETGAVLATPGRLFPGVDATALEPAATAAVKGGLRMAEVIANAVRNRQRVPSKPLRLSVDGQQVTLRPSDVSFARDRARASRKPHNAARVVFVKAVLERLARQLAAAQRVELDEDTRPGLLAELRESRDVRREVNLCWMPLSPQKLLSELYADPAKLAAAAEGRLGRAERRLLRRDAGSPWTPADVPLLDEAAELLGDDDTSAQVEAARAAAERKAERDYAQQALAMSGTADMMTADDLLDRYAGDAATLSVAERASEDREWAFGHVIVDEAQELSPMQWRLLMRRCPSRSMTVVGDIAQTGALAGASSWGEMLDPYVEGRWHQEQLTVNYRTPRRVMDVANDVLQAAGIPAAAARSVRDVDWEPTSHAVAARDEAALLRVVRDELAHLDGGRLAVLTSRADQEWAVQALRSALPEGSVGDGPTTLDAPLSVMTATEAKGLEFDAVVLVEPAALLAESARGVNDLFVAMTRPTQRLRVLHSTDLPAGLGKLRAA